jgi:adenosylhomocysteine nucleosidase
MPKVAIIAALEREVKPAVRGWRVTEREYGGRRFKFFESERAVLLCGGIGPEAARRATETAIALYEPALVMSVGFAGALEKELRIGDIFCPQKVVDAQDGSSVDAGGSAGILVTVASIASSGQKEKLARAYGAQAVDMEAAAVARGAQARGVRFMTVKAISDESDFDMPELDRFIREEKFRTTSFVAWTAFRPWLWLKVMRLARNSSKATQALSRWLSEYDYQVENEDTPEPGLHLIMRSKT